MNNRRALVSKLLPFSCVDGPGSRLVLFLQGCNLRCRSCHNPYTIGRCDDCAQCVATCPHQALSLQAGKVLWDALACQQCDTCLQGCPRQASPMALSLSVDDVLMQLRRQAVFIKGITVSGGEATLQLPFLLALFQAIRRDPGLQALDCLVDSNGELSEPGWARLIPWCDGVMVDLKAWDDERHRWLTGRGNRRILHSIRWLAQRRRLAELRLLVIPQHSDYLTHIDALAEFILSLGDVPVRLNAFHHHGVYGPASAWQPAAKADVERLAQALETRGVGAVIRPALYL
ncbi:YjjW family glycine radical enzyme activase [Edwardsiella piscicida]|uniref:YjjW family glycine radical enzyme activase n=1 Tax=Edwardsiella piscicida TaxID=1263550 RepID=UPI0009322731|nr:YjjW family glycine radical enzyme activase [Edwardsiella piscicida]EKS7813605.1 YjjW family glycine radical enzyme activase [Edwardsiella piscicida]UCQ21560.1 YjjW family glycine radical enzyme activase [Edwardsiella piscicida]WAM45182.1 YjjW family glycine radical enzyme activase [Edwardsiella piscicida]